MTRKLVGTLAAASFLLAAGLPGQAKDKSGWVDPPATLDDETVTYPDLPSDDAEPSTSASVSEPASPAKPSARSVTKKVASPRVKDPALEARSIASQPPSTEAKPQRKADKATVGSKSRAKAALAANKSRKRSQQAAGQGASGSGRSRSVITDKRRATPPREAGIRSVREALNAGFAVTTVRTFYLPDGRRIEVVTELDPVRRPGMAARPY